MLPRAARRRRRHPTVQLFASSSLIIRCSLVLFCSSVIIHRCSATPASVLLENSIINSEGGVANPNAIGGIYDDRFLGVEVED